MTRRRLWIVLLCIAAMLALGLWRRDQRDQPRVKVDGGAIERSIVAAATIRPAHGITRVRIDRPAKVLSVQVALGEHVKQGQRLAEIEYRSITPKATLPAGIAPPEPEREELRAPHAGTILERHLTAGEIIGPQDGALFELADVSTLDLSIEVDESQARLLQKGQMLRIVPLGGGESLGEGTVERLGPQLRQRTIGGHDPRVRAQGLVLPAWMRLKESKGWMLGQRLEVAIALAPVEVAARLPHTAIAIEDGRAIVRKPGAWLSETTPVTLGISDERYVEVRDLDAGTEVLAQP